LSLHYLVLTLPTSSTSVYSTNLTCLYLSNCLSILPHQIWPSIAESRGRRLAFLLANLSSQFTFLLLTDYLFKLHIGHWSHMGGLLTGLLLGPTLLQHSLPIGGVSLGEMVALAVPQQR